MQLGAVVAEREMKLRQALRTMGMLDSAFWLSWASTELILVRPCAGCSAVCSCLTSQQEHATATSGSGHTPFVTCVSAVAAESGSPEWVFTSCTLEWAAATFLHLHFLTLGPPPNKLTKVPV